MDGNDSKMGRDEGVGWKKSFIEMFDQTIFYNYSMIPYRPRFSR